MAAPVKFQRRSAADIFQELALRSPRIFAALVTLATAALRRLSELDPEV